jgi:hypothetical protein
MCISKIEGKNMVFQLALTLTLSPPSSLRFDAIAPKPKAKADGRGNSQRLASDLRMMVRPILRHDMPETRRTIHPLLGERAGVREVVQPLFLPASSNTPFERN